MYSFLCLRGYLIRIANFICYRLRLGVLNGVWASQLPVLQDHLNLSDGTFGLCVLCTYFGIVAATPYAGYLIRSLGSKWSTLIGAIAFVLSFPIMTLHIHISLVFLAMLTFGFTMGTMDVSMNACAVVAELVAGIPLMGSFHGSYSIAAAVSSLIGSSLEADDWYVVHAKYWGRFCN